MDKEIKAIKAIIKWEGGKDGDPILFLPQYAAKPGYIVCYAHIGQHSEAAMDYYHNLRNLPKSQYASLRAGNLITEYKQRLEKGEELVIVSRDTAAMRKERYAYLTAKT